MSSGKRVNQIAIVGTALFLFVSQALASGSSLTACNATIAQPTPDSSQTACDNPAANQQVRAAMRLVCFQGQQEQSSPVVQRVIVIGFLGGFVGHDDANHPEVWFAKYLRERYSSSSIFVDVFSNHEESIALHRVLSLLDTNCDGTLSDLEKKQARVIIYGHSWGASETAAFARDLGSRGIPVLLTAQIDIVPKPHQKSFEIPSNVEHAVNFFQSSGGFLHGQPRITADNPAQTKIEGNFPMSYRNHHIDCGNFPWFARTFNKPHHEIENDPRVWNQIKLLIDSSLRPQSPDSLAFLAAQLSGY
jgi:hypothetical protein